jgi:uncharacterized protein (UPF0332 family)
LATWAEMSRDSPRAANLLLDQGHLRSSISRAYYAAYCAIAGELASIGVSFARGWNNPTHDQLPALVAHNLSLPLATRRRINHSIRFLRGLREDADYRPGAAIKRADAIDCLQRAGWIMSTLEIGDD